MLARLIVAGCCLFVFTKPAFAQEDSAPKDYLWYDPAKIVTGEADADRCAACHKLEYGKWETTKHATNFKTLHETKRAKEISGRMGFTFMQYQSLCIKCHYTGVVRDGELQAVFGVSCQSCHGPARDFIEIHNKWGEGKTHFTEAPEHKAQRISQAKAAGMLRPSELYGVVANCFQCHTVPHEELVNKGEHPVGSSGFDLLKRIGEIRHNFLDAQFNASDTANRPDPPTRKRVMFVVGKAVDLEYAVRAVAQATVQGNYAAAIIDRASNASLNLQLVNSASTIPELTAILKVAKGVNLKPGNKLACLAAADKMREETKKFIERMKNSDGVIDDGGKLKALDNLIEGKEQDPAAGNQSATETSTPSAENSVPNAGAQQGQSSTENPAPASSPKAQPSNETRAHIRQFLRETNGHNVVGPSNCGSNCHKEQNEWAKNDNHLKSLSNLQRNPKALQIAGKYYGKGFNSSTITQGSLVCMDCHATVISGQSVFPARYGTSCESCHGPSSDFKEKHSSENPPHGYSVGKDYGMLLLENTATWAEDCAQCHYITDRRLIASGHPGDTYAEKKLNIVEASKRIKHWKTPADVPSELNSEYEKIKSARGPVPQGVAPITTTATPVPVQSESRTTSQPVITSSPVSQPQPSRLFPVIAKNIEIEAFPTLTDSISIEERMLILKKRLEQLYRQVGK